MCTRYVTAEQADIERLWNVTPRTSWLRREMFPRSLGPFIRRAVDAVVPERECVVGEWGLIPSM